MNESEWILKVNRLSKRYGKGCPECGDDGSKLQGNHCPRCGTVYAVRGVSFEVYPGEILGIVGESGSGKSTLLNCLYFDTVPSSGSAYLSCHSGGSENIFSVSAQSRRSIRNERLGKVYQSPAQGLRMKFSAIANVAENMISAGSRRVGTMEERARYLLSRVNIPEGRMKEAPERFSGGMQQRVQIAKALSNSPPLVLLDEVTTGLDLSVQARVLDLIESIRRESGVGMILVSHDLAVIRMLADRTMVMLGGKVVESGLTDQILEDPQHRYTQELVHSLL
jgi:putative phosphonate transport system ATP-binding protein